VWPHKYSDRHFHWWQRVRLTSRFFLAEAGQ